MSVSSLPRPVVFALIGGVLIAAVFFATHKSNKSDSSSSSSTPAPAAPAPKSDAGTAQSGSGKSASSTQGSPAGSAGKSKSSSTGTGAAAGGAAKSQSQSQASTGSGASAGSRAGATAKLPAPVRKAVAQHKTVVLLFWDKKGVDDREVEQAVAGLRGRSNKVKVFITGVGNVDHYVSITGKDGISGTPTLIVMAPNGSKDVQSGYIDEKTVENTVFNAAK